jgi:hypothetical protein
MHYNRLKAEQKNLKKLCRATESNLEIQMSSSMSAKLVITCSALWGLACDGCTSSAAFPATLQSRGRESLLLFVQPIVWSSVYRNLTILVKFSTC